MKAKITVVTYCKRSKTTLCHWQEYEIGGAFTIGVAVDNTIAVAKGEHQNVIIGYVEPEVLTCTVCAC